RKASVWAVAVVMVAATATIAARPERGPACAVVRRVILAEMKCERESLKHDPNLRFGLRIRSRILRVAAGASLLEAGAMAQRLIWPGKIGSASI
ncbi:MAG: hypothetical protein ACI80K_002307, partial [Paracoccaceae bacterium]